eukprot:CAMPEP_0119540974 /NCGR_PEP_ID=MMETSP1344-20130328/52686_1 /TAXON_ID=236787 /ORGANISM="Florenciella parvula, Strain CCMP2471" /LENGTH=39 /DNA_ID= /DNA_START= /DNA_END= /DNA_ORIENTATION=
MATLATLRTHLLHRNAVTLGDLARVGAEVVHADNVHVGG